jgi:hypothetical protein
MCRLQPVELARFDKVVETDREIDHLLCVRVEIAETELVRAVRVGEPALENRDYGSAGGPDELRVILMSSGRGYPIPAGDTHLRIECCPGRDYQRER